MTEQAFQLQHILINWFPIFVACGILQKAQKHRREKKFGSVANSPYINHIKNLLSILQKEVDWTNRKMQIIINSVRH